MDQWRSGDMLISFIPSSILTPELASEYAYMLFDENAEAYHQGSLKDFSQVGAKALARNNQSPSTRSYFLSLLNHYTWYPVHLKTIEKHGGLYDRATRD